MEKKNAIPDSDETARNLHADDDVDLDPSESESTDGLQTSNKSGKHSSVEKLAASRPEFKTGPGAKPVAGAFGDSTREEKSENEPPKQS